MTARRADYLAVLPVRVAGIPAQIGVSHWEPYEPAQLSGPPEFCHPAEGGWGDWELLDRRGRPAPWLERKLTAADEERIAEAMFAHFERADGDC